MKKTIGARRLTTPAVGTLAVVALLTLVGALGQPATANAAAAANWYGHQLDNDNCWDAIQWWNGARWTGFYWVDTNNDCTWGETYVADDGSNGSSDVFWLRRGNSGNWSTAIDTRTGLLYQGENQSSYSGIQYPGLGTWWKSQGYYQATVGPPTNPSGAYNLALAFARQGYVY
jgi:hypothetical protein